MNFRRKLLLLFSDRVDPALPLKRPHTCPHCGGTVFPTRRKRTTVDTLCIQIEEIEAEKSRLKTEVAFWKAQSEADRKLKDAYAELAARIQEEAITNKRKEQESEGSEV